MIINYNNPRILLGVTGSIAAYKSCELANQLTFKGASIRAIMTKNAQRFITPLTLSVFTGQPVFTNLFEYIEKIPITHIELARWANIIIIAPATANFIANIALGIANDLLTTTILATKAPLLIAPAMNSNMLTHPTVIKNLFCLEKRGAKIIGPTTGRTVCEKNGPGRMAAPSEIVEIIWEMLTYKDLTNIRLLVTAGPTHEHLDPVRFISNPSSGLTGIEIAREAHLRGAKVTLILGPTLLPPPQGINIIRITSAEEMFNAVLAEATNAQVIVKAAAVSDFKPITFYPKKIKKNDKITQKYEMTSTPDILATLGKNKKDKILVGFAAETNNLINNAIHKLKTKNLDFIVANNISNKDSGFGTINNTVTIISSNGDIEKLSLVSKTNIANNIINRIVKLLNNNQVSI